MAWRKNKRGKSLLLIYMSEAVSNEDISLIIDKNQIIVKRKVATKRPDDRFISKARLQRASIVKASTTDPNAFRSMSSLLEKELNACGHRFQ